MDALTADALAAATGDERALHAFVAAAQPAVWRLCRYLAGPEHADDATQETFVRAIAALPRFRGDSTARTWLLRIAQHTCADIVRRRRRQRAVLGRLHAQPPPAPVEAGTGFVDLGLLLAGLPAHRRAAFVLTQLLGLSYDEAAAVCECPIGTIRSRVARARDDLVRATTTGASRQEGTEPA